MRHLNPPTTRDSQWFQKITDAKQEPTKARLVAAKPKVLNAYNDYLAKAPEVDTVSAVNLTDGQRKALRHAYEVRTKPMSALRAHLMEPIAARRCPFCGIGEAATLDHYLPKEEYPQYAIFPKNLIPSCGRCNLHKSDRVLDDETGLRHFLHPYFDLVPDVPFLTVAMHLGADAMALQFAITQPVTVALDVFERLSSHFRLLGLADRYRLMSADELRGRYNAIASRYGPYSDAQAVHDLLTEEAQTLTAEYGQNHWRAVLYKALSAHDEFCDGGFNAIVA